MPKVTVVGWSGCPFFQKAKSYALTLQSFFPAQYQCSIDEAPDRASFRRRIGVEPAGLFLDRFAEGSDGREHTSCPLVFLGEDEYLGGHDAFKVWASRVNQYEVIAQQSQVGAKLSPAAGSSSQIPWLQKYESM